MDQNRQHLTHGLCSTCFGIDLDRPDLWGKPYPIADIVAGFKIGCQFCGLLTFSLDLKQCMAKTEDVSNTYVSLKDSGAEDNNCIIAELRGYFETKRAIFDIAIIQKHIKSPEHVIPFLAPRIPDSEPQATGSILERSFEWVRNRLDDCACSHTCGTSSKVSLPSRVLDVAAGDDATQLRILTPKKGTMGQYAALSYCWGRSNPFLLTPATKENLQNGFHLAQLPRTIRDAVRVTREIGIRYLWVDALCVMQGPGTEAIDEWNFEVAKMDMIYRDAYVTISAAAAQGASGGLFGGSNCELPFASSSTSAGRREVVQWARVTCRNSTPKFKTEPINSRAWTLQEHMLSGRVLLYCSFGLMWRCDRKLISAYSGESREFDFTEQTILQASKARTDNFEFDFNTSRYIFSIARNGNLRADFWKHILQSYTARNLTNPHDKLPALAAIAQRYADSTGAEYLAGLWRPTFRQDLLWRHAPDLPLVIVSDGGNPLLHKNEYRAPSWSWAAVDGFITSRWAGQTLESNQTEEYLWLAEIVTYPMPVLVNPQNRFGGVVKMAPELEMRGHVDMCTVIGYPDENSSEPVKISSDKSGFERWSLWVDDYTETAAWRGREREPLFCIHVLGRTWKAGTTQRALIVSLALLPVPERHRTYIRIGLAEGFVESTRLRRFSEATKAVIIV